MKRQKFNYEINQIKWDVESRFLMATNQSRSRGAVQVDENGRFFFFRCLNEGDFTLTPVHQMLGHTANCFAIEVDPRENISHPDHLTYGVYLEHLRPHVFQCNQSYGMARHNTLVQL